MRLAGSVRRGWRPGITTLALGLGAVSAQAADFKATLIVRDDDPRLERSRTERPALGQRAARLAQAVELALKDSRLELDSAGASL
ncbi:MAG: hypothetical protein EBY28_21955, partial [Betaproteobacteria bacterium]|nr:hypothetical protein [Betaproteobacteria bacterium]